MNSDDFEREFKRDFELDWKKMEIDYARLSRLMFFMFVTGTLLGCLLGIALLALLCSMFPEHLFAMFVAGVIGSIIANVAVGLYWLSSSNTQAKWKRSAKNLWDDLDIFS